MPIHKDGVDWLTPEEAHQTLLAQNGKLVRITTEGLTYDPDEICIVTVCGYNGGGTTEQFLQNSPYWRVDTFGPPSYVLNESIDFQC